MLKFIFSDCKFMIYPPSMIAAGSVGAAVHGLSNIPYLDVKLLQRLHEITGIEMVSSLYSTEKLNENAVLLLAF